MGSVLVFLFDKEQRMGTEDLIEKFIQAGIRAYKIILKGTEKYDCLNRHIPVEIEGQKISYWREYAVYTMAMYLRSLLPDVELECILDGNQSTITIELTNEEQRVLNGKLYAFLKKNKALNV